MRLARVCRAEESHSASTAAAPRSCGLASPTTRTAHTPSRGRPPSRARTTSPSHCTASMPHSPWKISVLMPRPDASKCVLKGDALSKAVAREPAAFGKRARKRFVRAELLARRIPLYSSLFPLPSSMHVFPRPGEPHPRAHASSAHAAALRFFFFMRWASFPLAACLLLAPTPCLFALPVRLAFSPLLARAQR